LTDDDYIGTNCNIFNNTCVMVSSAATRGIRVKTAAGLLAVYNNIIYDQAVSADKSSVALNVNGDGVVDYNFWFTSTSGPIWSTYANETATSRDNVSTYAAWKTAMGGSVDSHGISGSDPLFTASGVLAARYQLQVGSPALNVGKTGGVSGGATVHMGAWDGIVTRIGSDF
jgi:hypothetical protein